METLVEAGTISSEDPAQSDEQLYREFEEVEFITEDGQPQDLGEYRDYGETDKSHTLGLLARAITDMQYHGKIQ